MNTEDDKQLSGLYAQTDREQPAAHLDAAILAAARRETGARPHPAFSPFSTNWRVPVSLVAVLVLSIGLVNLMDDDVIPTDGLAPLGIKEGEVLPALPDAAGNPVTVLEERAPARAAKKSLGDVGQSVERQKSDDRDTTRLDFYSAPLEKSAPAPATTRVSPAVTPEAAAGSLREEARDRQLQEQKKNERAARKEKQEVLTNSTDSLSTLGAMSSPTSIAPVSVADITTLRKAGQLEQALLAADNFIRQHFGDDLNRIDAGKITLADTEWMAIVQELRDLGRTQQADLLENLRQARQGKAKP